MAKLVKSDFRPVRERINALLAKRRERIEADARQMAARMRLGEARSDQKHRSSR